MIQFDFNIKAPDLNSIAKGLNLADEDGDMSVDDFVKSFNEKSGSLTERAADWAKRHETTLSVANVSAKKAEEDPETADDFDLSVDIDEMDIRGIAKALGVPSPIAVIAASMGERGISGSLNAILKLNRRILSNEAVRQLKKRGMEAGAVYARVTSSEKMTVKSE